MYASGADCFDWTLFESYMDLRFRGVLELMLNESVDKYRGLNMFPVWEIVESVGVRKEEFASRTSLNLI